MKNFLFVVLTSLVFVGCGEHGPKTEKKPVISSQEVDSPVYSMPENATDLGEGRYLKLLEKEGEIYAGIVIPQGASPTERVEALKPGERRRWARAQLEKYSNLKWYDYKTEHKDGFTVIMFRIPTPAEEKEVERTVEEMKKPFIPQ